MNLSICLFKDLLVPNGLRRGFSPITDAICNWRNRQVNMCQLFSHSCYESKGHFHSKMAMRPEMVHALQVSHDIQFLIKYEQSDHTALPDCSILFLVFFKLCLKANDLFGIFI